MKNRKAPTKQNKAYAAKQTHIRELRQAVDAASAKAAKEWLQAHPEQKDLAVTPSNRVYIKNKEGLAKAILAVANKVVTDRECKKTQAGILREVQSMFPELRLYPNIWQRPLQGYLWKKVQTEIEYNMADIVSIRGCKTLADIKKKIKVNRQKKTVIGEYHPKISINKEALTIGETVYPVERRKAGGKTYPAIRVTFRGKRQWIRLSALVTLLNSE